jgi:hypothetical protein
LLLEARRAALTTASDLTANPILTQKLGGHKNQLVGMNVPEPTQTFFGCADRCAFDFPLGDDG